MHADMIYKRIHVRVCLGKRARARTRSHITTWGPEPGHLQNKNLARAPLGSSFPPIPASPAKPFSDKFEGAL
jgi:hypothetical protein